MIWATTKLAKPKLLTEWTEYRTAIRNQTISLWLKLSKSNSRFEMKKRSRKLKGKESKMKESLRSSKTC